MLRLISLIFILSLTAISLSAQQPDRPTIDALKIQLPTLTDSDKVTCLNRIASRYTYAGVIRSDSAIVYARLAIEEAQRIGFKRGLCRAYDLYANICLQQSKPDEAIRYFRLSTQVGTEIRNDTMVALGYRGVGQSLWYRGDFEEAIPTIGIAINYFRQLGMKRDITDATMTISSIYGNQGNYEKAFEIAQEALALSLEIRDRSNTVLSLVEIGKAYRNIGDHTSALDYYRKAAAWQPEKVYWAYRHLSQSLGDLYCDRKQYDSAWYYYQESFTGNAASKSTKHRLAEYYYQRQQYDSALVLFSELASVLKAGGEGHIYTYAILGLGKVHLAQQHYRQAKQYAEQALAWSTEKNARLNKLHACELLANIYDSLHQPTQSYFYYKQYVQLKEAVLNDQLKGKLYEFRRIAEDEKRLAQIQLLKQEKQINEQELKSNQWLKNILLAGLALLAFLSIMVLGNISLKRKNEKLRTDKIQRDLELRTTELEMQALRAQMNPHFIFNCLSSINRFILKHEAEKASDYLTRFSRLIRLVLINSQKPLIVLEDEVEMLRLYLEMEQLRFKNAFDYSITYNNDIEPANILLPPMLLQPFCENAIWHGLMHKEGHGQLSVAFNMQGSTLQCIISDNGIGRARAGEINNSSGEKIKSMGIKLTADRLALFNEHRSVQHYYKIEDITDAQGNITGTQVILEIRYKEYMNATI
ncbi:tetratricopeptide repeat-containing sensor histidine kinase [Paraflavitalea pollutisoli]|uniref:tetratricopeptide repeat-containing sensor histidine kinase n=1 Tax=Paraflavitalea pollutisoli TaxID=3034143 RepID=UPI0023EC80F4|nr:tetratricopeptide repeat protein [Paraflavitalea sp. H1-2-19X]